MRPRGNVKPTFRTRVLTLRQRLALTQVELAIRLGVSFATVNRWEAGRSEPQAAKLAAIEALEEECNSLDRSNFRDLARGAIEQYRAKGMILDAIFWARVVGLYDAALRVSRGRR